MNVRTFLASLWISVFLRGMEGGVDGGRELYVWSEESVREGRRGGSMEFPLTVT